MSDRVITTSPNITLVFPVTYVIIQIHISKFFFFKKKKKQLLFEISGQEKLSQPHWKNIFVFNFSY